MTENSSDDIKFELVSKTAILYACMLANAVLAYLNLILAVRFIGEIEYGILAFALSFEGMLVFITDLGYPRSHTKKVSEGADMRSCMSVFLLIRYILTAIYAAVVVICVLVWEVLLGRGYEYSETSTVLIIILVYNILISIRWTYVHTFYAQRKVLNGQAIMVSEVLMRMVATVVVILLDLGAVGLAMTFAVSGAGSLAVAYSISGRTLPRFSINAVNRPLLRSYTRFAAPIAVSIALATVVLYLDKVIIQMSLSTAETGAYFASQRLLMAFVYLGSAITVLVFPVVSQLGSDKYNTAKIAQVPSSVLRHLCVIVLPLTAFLCAFSEEILVYLLSSTYGYAAIPFAVLSMCYGLFVLTTPLSATVLGLGDSSRFARYSVVYALIVIVLDVVLIPDYILELRVIGLGLTGAALALLSAQIVNSVLYFGHSFSALRKRPPKGIARMLTASALSVLSTYFVSETLLGGIASVYDCLILLIFHMILFSTLTILTRAMTLSEMLSIARMIVPVKS